MPNNIIRSDVVQIGFDIDYGSLNDIIKQIDEIQNKYNELSGNDAFKKIKESAKQCTKPIEEGTNKTKKFSNSLKSIDTKSLNELDKKLTGITTKLGKGLVSAAKTATKTLVTMGTAAGAALGTIVYQSVSSYADYEQLIGGVETLFKDSAGTIQKYANDAYKTAGLSANEYMETVTGFSASLIQSLNGDTTKAAKYANMAITDMSDNANKMGTDIGMLQNAYGGFAKQNFTMLDNLKLGYGGTKEEMQRLLDDAEKLAGKKFDLSSYADIVEAIHVIQESMDITGTTAKEAEKTISGSLASVKSAWGNLLPAFVQGGDALNQCIDNLISSSKTFAGNLLPVVDNALTNILSRLGVVGESIQKVVDKIKSFASNSQKMDKIKSIFGSMKTTIETLGVGFANIVEAVVDFCTKESTLNTIKGIFDGINSTIEFCKEHFDGLSTAALAIGAAFLSVVGSVKLLNTIMTISKGIQIATTTVSYALAAARGTEVAATTAATAAQLGLNTAVLANPVTWVIVAIIAAIAALVAIIVVVVKNWDKVKAAAISCWETIKSVWGVVSEWFVTNIVEPVKIFFSGLWTSVKNTAISAWNGICSFFSTIATWINTNVIQPVKNFFTNLWYFIVGVAISIWEGLVSVFSPIATWINTNVIQPVKNFFTNLWHSIVNIVVNVWTSICTIWGQITGWISANIIQPVVNFFTNLWHSIVNIVTNVWSTICSIWGQISNWVSSNIIEPIKSFFSGLGTSIGETVSSVKDAITGAFTAAYDKVVGVWEGITGFFSGIWDGIKGTVNKLINKGKEALGVETEVKSKGKKHAWGGLMTTPHWGLVAEDGAEMIIPLSKDKRNRGISLWEQAGSMLGVSPSQDRLSSYTPETSSTLGTSETYNGGDTYSPVFNLTINGSTDERVMEYKVKQWLKEGMDEMARGLSRRNPRLREV